MPKIASITNTNKLVEDKVNFFIDWFHYCVDNIGKSKDFELENPLSLIDKILFQFENGKPDKRAAYIAHYFSHFFFTENEYLCLFDSYIQCKLLIADFVKASRKEKNELVLNPGVFVEKLILMRTQLQKEMFEKSLNAIISYFHCPHGIIEHKEDIKLHTKILVSEYLFRDRDQDDLNSVFNKVISGEVEKYPFPNNVTTKRQKQSHLSQSTLKQQFDGLLNLLYIPPKTARYIFKIYGASFDAGISFTYNCVTFYSKEHKKFASIKETLSHREDILNTFFTENQDYILASVQVKMHSEEVAVMKARKIIEAELKYVCWKLDRDLLIDTTKNYLTTSSNYKNYGWHFSTDSYHKKFYMDVIQRLNDNPFYDLKRVKSLIKNHLLEYEHLYINATKSRSVPDIWHYLETLLNTKKGEEKSVQKQVSAIALNNERQIRIHQILVKLSYVLGPINVNYEYLNLQFTDLKLISIELQKKKMPPILRQIQYPFIEDLIKEYDKKLTASHYKEVQEYYHSVMYEAFEQRNFYIHQGNINEKALIKLSYSIFQIVRRFRWALFAAAKKHPEFTFPQIIEFLVKEGQNLTI